MIIGAGSIGKRHWKIASSIKNDTSNNEISSISIVSKYYKNADFSSIVEGIKTFQPTHIVLATKTEDHFTDFQTINSNISGIDILIEKPIFKNFEQINVLNNNYYVAYNLRFSKIIEEIKSITTENRILHAEVYVGSFLPYWRPNIDYRDNYSAKKSEGGGVLRDLSHELDYIVYLFGNIRRVAAIVSKISSLEIDSEDLAAIVMESYSGTIISLTMNYISKIPIRKITMVSNTETYIADIATGSLKTEKENINLHYNMNDTYTDQLKNFLTDKNQLCRIKEGLYISKLIEAIESASIFNTWVTI